MEGGCEKEVLSISFVRIKLHPEYMLQKLKLLKTKIRCDKVHLIVFLIQANSSDNENKPKQQHQQKNPNKQKKKTNQTKNPTTPNHIPKLLMKSILTRYGSCIFSVLNTLVQSECHRIFDQGLLPLLIFKNNKPRK